eukprot:gene30487-39736_t
MAPMLLIVTTVSALLLLDVCQAFSIRYGSMASIATSVSRKETSIRMSTDFKQQQLEGTNQDSLSTPSKNSALNIFAAGSVLMTLLAPLDPVLAADVATSAPVIYSAIAAYTHYLGLAVVVASLTAERILIKPGMAKEEEEKAIIADILYGLGGVVMLASGYFRATQFEKGWEFYAHEPIFWVKMTLLAIMGASSLFPTIKLIQRGILLRDVDAGKATYTAMSDKLVLRLTKVINGELLAAGSIPLAATLMSRGVGYSDSFPWQLGAVPVALSAAGLGYKYVKEALTWEDENDK